jgi:multidrug transporter EmrE-like cation transporter
MSKLFANFVLILSVLFGITGQLLLKKATIGNRLSFDQANLLQSLLQLALNPYLLSWFLCGGISAALWILVVSKFELSFAFPVSMTLSYLLILILSWLIFNENMNLTRWVAVVLMCGGVILAYRS